ncbi:hypothetical protein BD410DRAFT_585867 [Rickenella mellea]|uniref:Uncharacterized protein n=1 Tax=Rickenella mellea TaxID=50990 RepID=A0A4Y7PNI9_9AGAM|nr:hypothetical protein BD410DRAFT_585867 [Rickenella mellea]
MGSNLSSYLSWHHFVTTEGPKMPPVNAIDSSSQRKKVRHTNPIQRINLSAERDVRAVKLINTSGGIMGVKCGREAFIAGVLSCPVPSRTWNNG